MTCLFVDSIFFGFSTCRLIEECWSEKPANRPTFKKIIPRLESICSTLIQRNRWKVCYLVVVIRKVYLTKQIAHRQKIKCILISNHIAGSMVITVYVYLKRKLKVSNHIAGSMVIAVEKHNNRMLGRVKLTCH